MNVFLENWDYFDTTQQRFAYVGTSMPLVAAGGRHSTNCCDGTDEQSYGAYVVSASGSTIIVGAAVQFPTASGLGKVFSIGDATASGQSNVYIRANDDGSLSAYRADDTILAISQPNVIALAGGYQYIEARVTIASGVGGDVEVRVNTSPVIKVTGVNTYRNGSLTPTLVTIYPQGRRRYDDMYINDTRGVVNADFEGDVRIDTHMPNANGDSSLWNRSTGTNQYETIDEIPPNEETDYNYTTVSGRFDAVGIQTLIPVLAGVRAICVLVRAKRVTIPSASGVMRSLLRLNGTNYFGDTYTPSTSGYSYFPTIYETSPVTASGFSDAEFDALQVGYRKEV